MTKFEVIYEGEDRKYHKFTFKSDRRLRYNANCSYSGIGYPLECDMMDAVKRISKREGTIMNRVGFRCPKRIVNTETGYAVNWA